MLQKTRTVSSDLGDRPDGKYYASTGVVYKDNATWKNIKETYMLKYNQARNLASSSVALPSSVGVETLNSSTRARPLFNEVVHSKKYSFNYAYLAMAAVGSTSGYYTPYYRRVTPVDVRVNFNTLLALPTVNWDELDMARSRAWWSMQPRFETEVALLNFIYELKDFKQIVKATGSFNWSRFAENLSKSRSLVRASGGKLNNKSSLADIGQYSRDVTKGVASGWLAWQFAIKPLIRDVAEMIKLAEQTVKAAEQEFSDRGLDLQKSHYTEQLSLYESLVGSGPYSEFLTGARTQSWFTATMEYQYGYSMRADAELFKKALGLNLTAEVLWNATPWTFLVDYVLPVGKAIRNMSVDKNVRLAMKQYCESVTRTSFKGIAVNPLNSCFGAFYCPSANGGRGIRPLESFTPLTGCSEIHYQRKLGAPNKGLALPRFKMPSTMQALNTLALVRGLI